MKTTTKNFTGRVVLKRKVIQRKRLVAVTPDIIYNICVALGYMIKKEKDSTIE